MTILRLSLPAFCVALGFVFAGCGSPKPKAENPPVISEADAKKVDGPLHAFIETEHGTIEIELFTKEAPKTTENFKLLAQRGYYNGLTFHRIVKGFMLQGGDPDGDGSGGKSAWGGTFEDEIDFKSMRYMSGYKRGIVAMANRGPNTNSSQFFILHKDYPLPPSYTIFGRVVKGIEVVDALAETPVKAGRGGEPSTPVKPVFMKAVTVKNVPAS